MRKHCCCTGNLCERVEREHTRNQEEKKSKFESKPNDKSVRAFFPAVRVLNGVEIDLCPLLCIHMFSHPLSIVQRLAITDLCMFTYSRQTIQSNVYSIGSYVVVVCTLHCRHFVDRRQKSGANKCQSTLWAKRNQKGAKKEPKRMEEK